MTRWLVGTMDEGLVHEAATKRECCEWIEHKGAPIKTRRVGPGDYQVTAGYITDERADTYWVMRPDVAESHGFEWLPRCPHGCGVLDDLGDHYYCTECGDEWDPAAFIAEAAVTGDDG